MCVGEDRFVDCSRIHSSHVPSTSMSLMASLVPPVRVLIDIRGLLVFGVPQISSSRPSNRCRGRRRAMGAAASTADGHHGSRSAHIRLPGRTPPRGPCRGAVEKEQRIPLRYLHRLRFSHVESFRVTLGAFDVMATNLAGPLANHFPS